jgi:hypothetical protein
VVRFPFVFVAFRFVTLSGGESVSTTVSAAAKSKNRRTLERETSVWFPLVRGSVPDSLERICFAVHLRPHRSKSTWHTFGDIPAGAHPTGDGS